MQLFTRGGEGVFVSKKHKDIIYLADGFNGLTIINGSNPL
jgi:hypothetical protein